MQKFCGTSSVEMIYLLEYRRGTISNVHQCITTIVIGSSQKVAFYDRVTFQIGSPPNEIGAESSSVIVHLVK